MNREEMERELYFLKGYKGYVCLMTCVEKVWEDESRVVEMRKLVYRPAAEVCGMTLENLERNLRTIRDVFFKCGGAALLRKHLPNYRLRTEEMYPRELVLALASCRTS